MIKNIWGNVKPRLTLILVITSLMLLASLGSIFLYQKTIPGVKGDTVTTIKLEAKDTSQESNSNQSGTPELSRDTQPSNTTTTAYHASKPAQTTPPTTATPVTTTKQTTTTIAPKTCNQSLANAYSLQYESSITSENLRYDQQVISINDDFARRGIYESGMRLQALATAEVGHENNLNLLYSNYALNMALAECSV